MEYIENIILGGGIAGLGASYSLKRRRIDSVVFEKDDLMGGLCGNFTINGFLFDRFVHFSFTNNKKVNEIFESSSPEMYRHRPDAYNLYKGIWLKHPAQNNLYPLSNKEKELIIRDFRNRIPIENATINNYEDWLRIQFGDYFAEHFPMVYTKKYWMKAARELRTEWIGQRIYQPSLDEVLSGCRDVDSGIKYYAKEMRYPKSGGYKHFLRILENEADVRLNKKIIKLDVDNKLASFEDGTIVKYGRLISSIPLPELIGIIEDVPEKITEAATKLECTCGYHISIGLNSQKIPPYLWWYIYDEDNLSARVHSPSLKSPNNAPEGCSSLQMEVYCKQGEYKEDEIISKTVGKLIEQGIIIEDDILFVHIGFEKYANVIFTHPIYEARHIVRDYLALQNIETIGRFGEWDYLWSDQSLLSGLRIK